MRNVTCLARFFPRTSETSLFQIDIAADFDLCLDPLYCALVQPFITEVPL